VSGSRDPDKNFVVQQGVPITDIPGNCSVLTGAMLFQPRLVGLWILVGAVLQSGYVFLALALVLWWSALVPAWNPFELVYRHLPPLGRTTRPRLGIAAAPRRFAQGMAGAFAASIGLCLLGGARVAALVLGIVFALAVAALLFGRLCLGSFVYHLLRGRAGFALRTLPWGRGL